ncbi:MAG TPA: sulfite exporter TauE/SafE family protein [Pirellulales bacterium]|nr:sulfite exporter TauE/SafE family protein [Pirellulales bacterium]
MYFFQLFLFGCAIGVMSGLMGIGGGIALVPGLMMLFHFTQQQAQGTSLAVLIPPIGIFAALVYYQNGFVKLPVVGWIALGFAIGAFLGAKLVVHIPAAALQVAFGLVLLYVGFEFAMTPLGLRRASALPAGAAALGAAMVARFVRRKRDRSRAALAKPSDELEYHI